MQTSVYVNSENYHLLPKLFHIGILQQMLKMSAICRNTSTETLARHCLTALSMMRCMVHALPLLSDALPQLIQSPDILSVDTFLEHPPIHDSLLDLDPDC